MLKPVDKVSITDSIIKQLIAHIQADLKPGDKLPSERVLIDMLSVGRTSVRESLRALEVLGIVETRPGEGTFVAPGSGALFTKPLELGLFSGERTLREIYEARRVMEVGTIELITDRIKNDEIEQCAEVLKKMRDLDTSEFKRFLDYDYQFHRILAAASGNGVVIEMLKLTRFIIEEERQNAPISAEKLSEAYARHEPIVDALRARDKEAAMRSMASHMDWTQDLLGL
jgi:GntR family transcriptional repressor for pyruvate dehydrogenase complex